MNWTNINLNTFWPEVPQIMNANFTAFKNYLDVFYNETTGVVIVPINTTGKVKGGTGEFVNLVVDNLTVKKQYTNLLSNSTSADSDYYNTYIGLDASTRSASTGAYENTSFRYIDAISPYYKISNDVSIAFKSSTLGQVVDLLFDPSVTILGSPFNIQLDSHNKVFIDSLDASKAWMQLICVGIDTSLLNTWVVKQYGGTFTKVRYN